MRNSEALFLRQLACECGVEASYADVSGKRRVATPETLKKVLSALGAAVKNAEQTRDSLRRERERTFRERVEPVIVAWQSERNGVLVSWPESESGSAVECRLRAENGGGKRWAARPRDWTFVRKQKIEGVNYVTSRMPLSDRMPAGYYDLEIETGSARFRSLVLAAPRRAFREEPGRKRWGLFIPTYALHSERGWGAGDLSDLERVSAWGGKHGATVVATLPLLAAFLDWPFEPSPYAPASRLFWNEFYLDIEWACRSCGQQRLYKKLRAAAQAKTQQLERASLVRYREVMNLKRAALDQLASAFFSSGSSATKPFCAFVQKSPRVEDYARFRAAMERRKKSWREWPARMREGSLQPGDYDERARRRHLLAQWLMEEQLTRISSDARKAGRLFYLDLPLGVHPEGYDAWRGQEVFAHGANTGAPPDAVFTKGQDWGFAPLHPRGIREQGYRYVREYLETHMRHAGLLRLDHVMGLHRLYWVPHGASASEGAYVRYRPDEWHAILNIESHRRRTALAGENLGTVPPEVNAGLSAHGIRELYVVAYEAQPEASPPLRKIPSLSVASLNTHDMPAFRAFWEGRDLDDRFDLGLLKPKELKAETARREKLRNALLRFLRRRRLLEMESGEEVESVFRALLMHMSASAAEWVLINLEDLWLETQPQNVPGTSVERPNWRRKAKLSLEEIQRCPKLAEILAEVNRLREKDSPAAATRPR